MENGNYIVRQWKVTLYQREPFNEKRKIIIVFGDFIDVFYKIKNEMDSEYYSSFKIEEVE